MKKLLKILLYTIIGILLLIVGIVIFLTSSAGQKFVTKQTTAFLSNKIKTPFSVGAIKYKIPTSIAISDLLLIDQNDDTLAYLHQLDLNVNMLKLLNSNLSVNSLDIDGAHFYMHRKMPDTTFNFQYIITAFAGETPTDVAKNDEDTKQSNPFKIEVVKTNLKNIYYRLHDESGGIDFSINVDELLLKPNFIDLEALAFDVEELRIKGVKSNLIMTKSILPESNDTSKSTSPFNLKVNKLLLNNIEYAMDMKESPMYMKVNVATLETRVNEFDLTTQFIDISKLYLSDSKTLLVIGKESKTGNDAIKTIESITTDTLGWRILANDVKLKNIQYTMDNNNEPVLKDGMDYAHMDIQNVYLIADNLLYTNDTISGVIKQLTLKEKCGIIVDEFRTKFNYNNKGAILENLLLKTPETTIQNKLAIHYQSLESLTKDLGKMSVDIALENSSVGINDVLLFVPADLRKTLAPYKGQHVNIASTTKGLLENLNINSLKLSGFNNTIIDLNGTITGLPNTDILAYNFNINQLQTSKEDIEPFLTDSIKMMVNIPKNISANGSISGGIYQYNPNLKVITTDGNAFVHGSLNIKPEGAELYNLDVQAINLNLGRILRQDSIMGPITTNIKINGSSFDIKKMNTDVDLNIFDAYLMGYNYSNIKGKVKLNSGLANTNITARDNNLNLDLTGTAKLDNEYPDINALLNINNIDLFALKLSNDTMKLAGIIEANIPAFNVDYPNGTIIGSDLEITIPNNKLPLDSIRIIANSNPNTGQNIILDIAKIVNLNLTGQIPLTKIGNAYMYHINKYYNIGDTFENAANYTLDVKGKINYNPILSRFDRNIKPFDTVNIKASLDHDNMYVGVQIPRFRYSNHVIDSGYINILEAGQRMSYSIGTKKYDNRESLQLHYPHLYGNIQNDTVYARVEIKDSAYEELYNLGVAVNKDLNDDNSNINLRVFQGLMINKHVWNVNKNNQITINNGKFKINDLFIKHSESNQSISINSIRDTFNSPLALNIKDLKLHLFSTILDPDTLFDGVMNTAIEIDLNPPIPFIKGNASINDFAFSKVPLGNILLNATTVNDNTYNAKLSLDGNGNNVVLAGDYHMTPVAGNNFNFNLNIAPLALKSVEGFTGGNIKNTSGSLEGQLNIKGTFDKPKILGNLFTNNIVTTVDMINGTFSMPKEKISFTDKGIIFDKFNIYDYRNEIATLDGSIRTRDFKRYILDLNFKSNNWSPVNSTARNFEMFYGKLFMSSDIKLKGNMTGPNITGNLTIHDSTKLAFALIDSDPQIVETEGIVQFFDHRYPNILDEDDSIDNVLKRVRFSQKTQMNVNVGVEKNAAFNLIIDPSTGDNLLVKGEAALNAQIAPNGSIGLAGTYALEDGYYELSFPPVKRKFTIQKGSTISLSGDPLDAVVDIVAVYKSNVSPYDLVEKQVSDPTQLVYYKQRLPFEVQLKLNGKALSPNITFDIVLPEQLSTVSSEVATTVQSKLTQMRNNTSEINKQVFAVIVLNRFITDESFNSGNVVNVEYVARQSVSRFLSSQLNNLAGQLISGFDINMDLESTEDYTTGSKVNRTDLNVSASKSLFDDRLSVTVGNDFLIEGANNAGGKSAGIPGNISADYKLTEDGRYILRGYRKNELQNLIDGYVIETGLGFRYSLQYNKFKYLFMNKEKLRAKYRQLIEEERKKQQEREAERDKRQSKQGNNNMPVSWLTVPTSILDQRIYPSAIRTLLN